MNVSQWLFSNIPGDDEVSQTAAPCTMRGPDIVRLRIAFELWRFRKACKAPLPISEFDLPDCVRQSIAFDLGYSAVSLACKLWRQPGAQLAINSRPHAVRRSWTRFPRWRIATWPPLTR
jgi:hypothetical protein